MTYLRLLTVFATKYAWFLPIARLVVKGLEQLQAGQPQVVHVTIAGEHFTVTVAKAS